jgi:desulfoferrodoxin (superoxide reductase-like protein)
VQLTANPTSSLVGTPVTLTATLSANNSDSVSGAAGESVAFFNGLTHVGSGVLNTNGVATLTLSTLPAGSLSLAAYYYPDANFAASTGRLTYVVGQPAPAVMLTPAANSTLASATPTFTWTTGVGVSDYFLYVGTAGVGSSNILYANEKTATTATVTVPTTGSPLYVRLYSNVIGTWQHSDYVYTESGTGVAATMLTPAANSTLASASANFTWTTGVGVSDYFLYVGTTGVGSSNILYANERTATTATVTVPTTGSPLYVRLYSNVNGTWQHSDYVYTESGTGVAATMLTPAANSTLASASANFTWTTGVGVSDYFLYVGTTGVGSSNILYANEMTATTATVTVPTTGSTLYVRLYSNVNGTWQHSDYVYTESGSPVPSVILTPTPSSTLTGASTTFTWTNGGASDYYLYVGTTGVGASDILFANEHTNTTATVTVPTTGKTLYVRLYSNLNGTWHHSDYTYTEQ